MQHSDYIAFRREYHPANVQLIIVAESPPVSGLYFYNRDGVVSEPLFSALAEQAGLKPTSKEEGLRALQAKGWLLVDATYEPVNSYDSTKRDAIIVRDYPRLRDDLLSLTQDRSASIILVKANVCALLGSRLTTDGFKVLNRGQTIYFPSHGQQGRFRAQFADVLRTHSSL
jgi:hypothetical protein